jgi:hypothetical protein
MLGKYNPFLVNDCLNTSFEGGKREAMEHEK